ncbi:MAG: hypothetical protein KME08_15630 [Aphanothece sp. CMT-3BRIN-NPC111]|jgi:hemolysin activation/secretion protein|nr:hypothetical protein [Aphanothece sp. CMT-3BRIN-NPC111]
MKLLLPIYLCLVSLSLSANQVLAQNIPSVPPESDPSRIQREIQPPPLPTEERPQITPPSREDLTPPPEAEQLKFRLESLQVEGATVYSPERLQQIYARYLGQAISLKELYDIANEITQLYRNDGYFLSRAIVPEQTIDQGVVRLQVIEGFVERVDFQGAPPSQLRRLRGFGNKITGSRPLNIRQLERYLLLINDLAGFHARAVLSPGSSLGAAILTANVSYDATNTFFDINNRGSVTVGPLRTQVGVYLNSLLSQGEQISLSGTTTPVDISELGNLGLDVSLPLGYEGLRLNLDGSYTKVQPGAELEQFAIEGKTTFASLGAAYPLVRSRDRNFTVNGKFDYTDSRTTSEFIGIPITLSEDRLRVLRLGATYDQTDSQGLTFASAQVSQGIGGLGATTVGTFEEPLSRARGRAEFTKLNLDIIRRQNLPKEFTLQLAATAQITGNALLVSEQFGLGGATFGSAFNSSELLGDYGYGLRAEVQRQFVYRVKGLGLTASQPYIFYDYGQVFRKFPTAAESSSDALSSAGLGLRQSLSNGLLLQAELAFPVRRTDSEFNSSPRFFFGARGFF